MTWLVAELGALVLLLRDGLRAAPRMRGRDVVQQAYEVANRSALFIGIAMAFMGGILVSEAAAQAQRLVGDLTIIGGAFLQLLVAEFGPSLVALMLAARYGAGAAAELASMQVTEQIDAWRMSGADPVADLVAPRLFGGLLGCIPVTVWGIVTAYGAGAVVAHAAFGTPWATYLSLDMVRRADVVLALCKTLLFGLTVPLVACRAGLLAHGGAPAVGRAATQATVHGLMLLLLLDLLLDAVSYWVMR